ncbi:fimbrial protein [Salmonella enterica subsp. enterica serovar Chester]
MKGNAGNKLCVWQGQIGTWPISWGILMLIVMLFIPLGHATETLETNVTISYEVLEPVCTITDSTDSNKMEVKFDNVDVTDVNTEKAQRLLPLKVTCSAQAPENKVLKMAIVPITGGTIPYAGQQVLRTSIPGLGIQLRDSSGEAVVPGADSWHDIIGVDTSVSTPIGNIVLTALLVSEVPDDLSGGMFTSSASLIVAYM